MGNSGGDNRVEFGTRLDHSIWYESPKLLDGTVSFDLLVSPGANRTYDNVVQSAGSPDCSGGNMPGSAQPAAELRRWGLRHRLQRGPEVRVSAASYATAAWELHHAVNRNRSDGIGSSSPYYGYLDERLGNSNDRRRCVAVHRLGHL